MRRRDERTLKRVSRWDHVTLGYRHVAPNIFQILSLLSFSDSYLQLRSFKFTSSGLQDAVHVPCILKNREHNTEDNRTYFCDLNLFCIFASAEHIAWHRIYYLSGMS